MNRTDFNNLDFYDVVASYFDGRSDDVRKIAVDVLSRIDYDDAKDCDLYDLVTEEINACLIYSEDEWALMTYYQNPSEASLDGAVDDFTSDLVNILRDVLEDEDEDEPTAFDEALDDFIDEFIDFNEIDNDDEF